MKANQESPRGFISAPTLEQLKPTKEEQAKLKVLWDWLHAPVTVQLGVPSGRQKRSGK